MLYLQYQLYFVRTTCAGALPMDGSALPNWDDVFLDNDREQNVDLDGIDIDPSHFLDNPFIDFAEEEEEKEVTQEELPQKKRRPGRPRGTFGSAHLRVHQKAAQAVLQERAEAKRPQPGSIEYARSCKKNRVSQDQSSANADPVEDKPPCGSIMDANSSIWSYMLELRTPLLQAVAAAAEFSMRHQTAEDRDGSETAAFLRLKSEAIMSDRALTSALKSQGHSDKMRVDRLNVCTAAACLLGSGAAWGASLESIRQQVVVAKKWRAILFLEKCRYDETPLRVRIEGPSPAPSKAAARETCQHGKVLQVELTVHMVLEEISSGRRVLFAGRQPVALQVLNRNTAECILKALRRARSMIPGIEQASSFFDHFLRIAVPGL